MMSGLIRIVQSTGIRAASACSRTSILSSSCASTSPQRRVLRSLARGVPSIACTATFSRCLSSAFPSRRIEVDPDVIYEYSSQSNPAISGVPIRVLNAEHHQTGASRVTPFDLSKDLGTPYPATSPNLLTSFVRVVRGEKLTTTARATSQGFYVIRGEGKTVIREEGNDRTIGWKQGDLFVVPYSAHQSLEHHCNDVEVEHGGAALYWIHDEPLLRYLGVQPCEPEFTATLFTSKYLLDKVEKVRDMRATQNQQVVLHRSTTADA